MAEPHDPGLPPVPQEPGPVRPAGGPPEGDGGPRPRPEPEEWVGGGPAAPGTGYVPDGWGGGAVTRPLRNPVPPAEPSKRALALELLAMFVLAFAVPLLGLFTQSSATTVPADTFAFSVVASAVIQWFPIGVLYLLLRRRGGWSSIGLTRLDTVDLTAGFLLWLASHVTVFVLAVLTQRFGTNNVEFLPPGLPIWELALLSLVIALTAGLVEEILVRGYAQTRLQQLGVPALIVVVAPTALWAVLHLYQGVGPAVTIFGLGLVYATWFQWTRRLWPVVIAHALFDLSTLVLIMISTFAG